jgi:hypothetical protein
MSIPETPSMGLPCQSKRQGNSPRTAGKNTSARIVPIQRSHAEPPGRERIQVQPSPPSHRGRKKAVRPSDCTITSPKYAPKRPIQLWGRGRLPAVFSEGSVGW